MKTKAGALVLMLALSGCGGDAEGGGSLDSTGNVCDSFAAHSRDGLPAAERADVVDSIGEVIDNADQQVQDAYPPLQNTASASDSAYRTAADGFAQACFDAGWDG